MGERIRGHLRSNVVGYVALFIALSGVAYAAGLKKDSVKSKHIKNGQVLTQDIGDEAVGTPDLADGAVTAGKLSDGAIPGLDPADGSVTTEKLVNGAVTNGKLAANAVNGSKVGDDALGGADINENSLVGVDAAMLGGVAAGAFALVGHNHDATYVNEGQANSVDAAMITDPTRAIQIPLQSLIECDTNSGANINYANGGDAFPDFVNRHTDGEGFFLRFDADAGKEDQDVSVCAGVTVPPDARDPSGPVSLFVRALKDGDTGAEEDLFCTFGVNGAFQTSSSVEIDSSGQAVYECPGPSGLANHDVVSIAISVTSPGMINDQVDVLGIELDYTAVQ